MINIIKQEQEMLNNTTFNMTIEDQAFILGYWTSHISLLTTELEQVIFYPTIIEKKVQAVRNINSRCKGILDKIKTITPFSMDFQKIKENLITEYSLLLKKSTL